MAIPPSYKSVVVVDDEPAVLQLLTEVVRKAGYVPHPASSAEEAMELLGEVASETCLVISDVVMGGMDGRELAQWIRAQHPELPVLLVSGYMPDQESLSLPPGVTFRRKPLSIQEIQELVEDSCGIG
ncbi:MAG: response regulator [Fimbriimonadales bacterium]